MNRHSGFLGLAALWMAAAFVSCQREEPIDTLLPEDGETVTLHFTASFDDEATRTTMTQSGNNVSFTWDQGDRLYLRQIYWTAADSPIIGIKKSEALAPDGSGNVVFRANFPYISNLNSLLDYPGHEGKCFMYQGFYPSTAVSFSTSPSQVLYDYVQLTLPASQSPRSTSFDPKADILYSRPLYTYRQRTTSSTNTNYQSTEIIKFNRLNAIGVMELTGLPQNKAVEYIKFISLSQDTPLAGTVTTRNNTDEFSSDNLVLLAPRDTIKLNYGGSQSTTSGGKFTAYFTCLPGTFTSGMQFRVKVKLSGVTDEKKRTVGLTGSQQLAFRSGKATRFSVNMAGQGPSVNLDENTCEVTMMTYNVYTFDMYGAKGINRDIYEDMARVIDATGATLVGLNEVDRYTTAHNINQAMTLKNKLNAIPGSHNWNYHFSAAKTYTNGAYGNAVLFDMNSQTEVDSWKLMLPNKNSNNQIYKCWRVSKNEDGTYSFTQKNEEERCVSVIETEDCVFATVHMALGEACRTRQVEVLNAEFKRRFLNYGKPVFLCGDFNADTAPFDMPVTATTNEHIRSVDELMGTDWKRVSQDTTITHPSTNIYTNKRLDHFFIFQHAAVKDATLISEIVPTNITQVGLTNMGWGFTSMKYFSDHRPRAVTVKWRKASTVSVDNNLGDGTAAGKNTTALSGGSF